jgi:hypothetical protein
MVVVEQPKKKEPRKYNAKTQSALSYRRAKAFQTRSGP